MIHGQANPKDILYRSRSKALGDAFVEGFKAASGIELYKPNFNAGYVVDKMVDSNFYLIREGRGTPLSVEDFVDIVDHEFERILGNDFRQIDWTSL